MVVIKVAIDSSMCHPMNSVVFTLNVYCEIIVSLAHFCQEGKRNSFQITADDLNSRNYAKLCHMKELLLLRHAKSSWSEPVLADYDRPLNKRGKDDAPRMGDFLRREDLVPDLIISSTAKRARHSAELVADAAGYEGDILLTRELYHADPNTFLEIARDLGRDQQRLLLVGHNPGIEYLVEALSGYYERMPTAAIAYFQLSIDAWAQLDEDTPAKLLAVWLPREVE